MCVQCSHVHGMLAISPTHRHTKSSTTHMLCWISQVLLAKCKTYRALKGSSGNWAYCSSSDNAYLTPI